MAWFFDRRKYLGARRGYWGKLWSHSFWNDNCRKVFESNHRALYKSSNSWQYNSFKRRFWTCRIRNIWKRLSLNLKTNKAKQNRKKEKKEDWDLENWNKKESFYLEWKLENNYLLDEGSNCEIRWSWYLPNAPNGQDWSSTNSQYNFMGIRVNFRKKRSVR